MRCRLAVPALLAGWAGGLLLPGPALAQCAMCRTALQSPQAAALARAIGEGTLLLLSAPFLAIGCVAWLVVGAQRAVPAPEPEGEGEARPGR